MTPVIKPKSIVLRISATVNLLINVINSVFQASNAVTTSALANARKKFPIPITIPITFAAARAREVVISGDCSFRMAYTLTSISTTSTIPTCSYANVGATNQESVPSKVAMAKLLTPASLCAHVRSSPMSMPMQADPATFAASSKSVSILKTTYSEEAHPELWKPYVLTLTRSSAGTANTTMVAGNEHSSLDSSYSLHQV